MIYYIPIPEYTWPNKVNGVDFAAVAFDEKHMYVYWENEKRYRKMGYTGRDMAHPEIIRVSKKEFFIFVNQQRLKRLLSNV